MRHPTRHFALWGLAAWLAAAGGAAAEPVVRSADHPGFGRLVFEFDGQTGFNVTRDGDHVALRFDRPDLIPGAAVPRNVLAYHGIAGGAELQLVPGARLETMQLGNRVVVDVRDALPARSAAKPGAPAASVPGVGQAGAAQARSRPAGAGGPGQPKADPVLPGADRSVRAGPADQVLRLPMPGPSNVDAVAQAVERALAAPVEPIARERLPAASHRTEPPAAPTPAAATPDALAPAVPPASIARPPVEGSPALAASAAALQPAGGPVPDAEPAPTMAVAARPLPAGGAGELAFLLPFSRGTGAAAFRRGDRFLVVFDERRPIDLAALGSDTPGAGPAIQLLPDATLLTVPLTAAQTVRLRPAAAGWEVHIGADAPGPPADDAAPQVVPVAADGQIRLALQAPGRSVVVPDRMTGGNLLVGTQRGDPPVVAPPRPGATAVAGAPAAPQGVAVGRQSPGFVLLASTQGIAVEPVSDRISLRAVADGFRLEAAGADLLTESAAADLAALMDGAALTRRFDFPDRPTPDLMRRTEALVADAAAASPRARLAPRLAAAQAMIALGLGPEAQALLAVAAIDDPQAVEQPDLPALSAIGGLVAGRPDADHALGDPRLTGTDEIEFWRAVAALHRPDGTAAAAPVFAATLPLLLAYPPALVSRLLPVVAQTLVQGGETRAAERLLAARPQDADLGFARGQLAEVKGDVDTALADYDALAIGHDRMIAAEAGDQAIALRLRTGRIDAAQAADAMQKGLFNWRETPRELPQRRKIAELRAQSHAWREALAMLRETAQLFPEAADSLRAELHDQFAAMLNDQPAVGAFDLVMIADENADLMQQGEAGAKAAMLLADRLTTLDLPDRAIPLLDRLMRGATDPLVRAQLGLRLAAMRLAQSDANGALASLTASDAANLPADLAESRQLLDARALAAKGDLDQGIAVLTGLGSDGADLLRADLLSDAKNWPGAEAALQSLAARLPAGDAVLPAADQDVLLRLAGAAAQAGDDAQLQRLRPQGARLDGHRADLFRMLTAAPVAELHDLPRAAREAAAARDVPSELQTLAASNH